MELRDIGPSNEVSLLKNLIQNLSVGILVEDNARRIWVANAEFCRLFGFPGSPDLLQGSDCRAGLQALQGIFKHPQVYLARVEAIVQGRIPVKSEAVPLSDGRVLELDYVPLQGPSLSSPGHLWQYRDITDRVRAVEALAQSCQREETARQSSEAANLAKTRFLATMSHELRTPLNAILGMTELLVDTPLTTEQAEHLAIIHASGESLLHLVQDLLEVSKVESGDLELREAPFRLSHLLEGLLRSFSLRAQALGSSLRLEISKTLPALLIGDATRLEQIFSNLITNALKHTIRGIITIRASATPVEGTQKSCIVVEVEDTGDGIPPEHLERVFERFYQVGTSPLGEREGTGLGLHICRMLLEKMGGTISVTSTIGKGSIFRVEVVLSSGPLPPLTGRTSALLSNGIPNHVTAPAPPARRLRILMAEDHEPGRLYVQKVLSSVGHELVTVPDGQAAVQLACRDHFDLILMDLQMPILDGMAAARAIRVLERELGRTPIPILALTAHAVSGFRERCLEAGMDDYLTKPLNREVLLAALYRWGSQNRGTGAMEDQTGTAPHTSPSSTSAPEAADASGTEDLSPIEVPVDPFLMELIPGYLAQRRREIQSALDNWSNSSPEELRILGHNLKGSGGAYGFPIITTLGGRLSEAARAGALPVCQQVLSELNHYLKRVVPVPDEAESSE